MPILFKSEENSAFLKLDVENLITNVRDHLCLKNQTRSSTNHHHQRSAPYNVGKRPLHTCGRCCCHSSGKCGSSRSHLNSEQVLKYRSAPCLHDRSCDKDNTHSSLRCGNKTCSRDSSSSLGLDDPHVLLQKLIAEQSLIQEAVRRLQSKRSTPCASAMYSLDNLFSDTCEQLSSNSRDSAQSPSFVDPEIKEISS